MFLQLADHSNPHLRNMALDALDRSISSVLDSDKFQAYRQFKSPETSLVMRPSTIFMAGKPIFYEKIGFDVCVCICRLKQAPQT